jgi:hypothetical protein
MRTCLTRKDAPCLDEFGAAPNFCVYGSPRYESLVDIDVAFLGCDVWSRR